VDWESFEEWIALALAAAGALALLGFLATVIPPWWRRWWIRRLAFPGKTRFMLLQAAQGDGRMQVVEKRNRWDPPFEAARASVGDKVFETEEFDYLLAQGLVELERKMETEERGVPMTARVYRLTRRGRTWARFFLREQARLLRAARR
jgi:hypothetical protein